MRTTVTIDDELMAKAMALTGRTDRAWVIREALRTLVAVESGRRLATLGGSDPQATAPSRRRTPQAS